MSSSILSVLLIAAVTLNCLSLVSAQTCNVQMFRTVGDANSYVWICDDERSGGPMINGEEKVIARIQVNAPSTEESSTGRMARTVRCFDRAVSQDDRLVNCCDRPRRWESLGATAVSECIASAARDDDVEKPFKYNMKQCTAVFASSSPMSAVWVCKCKQPRPAGKIPFEIAVGRAEFSINMSPTSGREEVAFVKRCTRASFNDLRRVCRNTPGNFETLALQLMQACCKRARNKFPEAKLNCASIVP